MDEERALGRIRAIIIDDYYGLWELLSELRAEFPEMSVGDARILARRMVLRLVEQGEAEVYRGVRFAGEESKVPDEDVESALLDDDWQMRGDPLHLRVTSSDSAFRKFTKTDAEGQR